MAICFHSILYVSTTRVQTLPGDWKSLTDKWKCAMSDVHSFFESLRFNTRNTWKQSIAMQLNNICFIELTLDAQGMASMHHKIELFQCTCTSRTLFSSNWKHYFYNTFRTRKIVNYHTVLGKPLLKDNLMWKRDSLFKLSNEQTIL